MAPARSRYSDRKVHYHWVTTASDHCRCFIPRGHCGLGAPRASSHPTRPAPCPLAGGG